MRLRARVLLILLGTLSCCTLPLEEKAACEDTRDCLDGRACVGGQCTDGACGFACEALCSARNDCTATPSSTRSCDPELTTYLGLDPVQCGMQYDLLEGGSCEAESCFDGCIVTCGRGVECALIEDAATCTVQCQREPSCTGFATACNELDAAALSCWAGGEARGC